MPVQKRAQRRQRVPRRIVLGVQQADQGVEAGEMDLFGRGGGVDARGGDGGGFVVEVGFCRHGDVDGDDGVICFVFWRRRTLPGEVGEEVVRENGHHHEPVLEGGGFGCLVGVLRREEDEEPFWAGAVVVEEGGGRDLEVGQGRRVEGGVEDVEGFGGGGCGGGGGGAGGGGMGRDCLQDAEFGG